MCLTGKIMQGKKTNRGRASLLPAILFTAALTASPAVQAENIMGQNPPEKAPIEYALPTELATETLLLGVAKAGDRLVAVGNWGHIVLSDDKGLTWRQAQKVPTRTTLTSVYFTDDKHGWAVGHDTIILHTQDGGETWEMQYSDPPAETPLLTVWFANSEHGIAAGSFSFMLETFDGGKTWENRPVLEEELEEFEEPHLNMIFWGPDRQTQVLIASEAGNFFRSSDAGKTWEILNLPYRGSFWSGMVTKTGRILALGMRGHIFRSDDFGNTWEQSATGADQSYGGGVQLSDGVIVAVGLAGTVSYSSDNGESFTTVIRPSRTGLTNVAEGANDQVVLFGDQGIALQPAHLPKEPPPGS
ncbi:MAG TPA: hypothetical protein DCO82_06085 [Alphaproteobacteria bacterium]|nr:hypothetical protein [Alphaproteobacteria bacterium]